MSDGWSNARAATFAGHGLCGDPELVKRKHPIRLFQEVLLQADVLPPQSGKSLSAWHGIPGGSSQLRSMTAKGASKASGRLEARSNSARHEKKHFVVNSRKSSVSK